MKNTTHTVSGLFFFVFGCFLLLSSVKLPMCSGDFKYRQAEDLVQLDQYGKPVPEELQVYFLGEIRRIEKTLKDNPIPEKEIIPLADAWEMINGKDGLKEFKKQISKNDVKWIQYGSSMDNLQMKTKTFVEYAIWHQFHNLDMTEDKLIDTGHRDLYGNPIYAPKHFWDKVVLAAENAGMKNSDIDLETGTRWHPIGIYMWVRTVHKHCKKNPSDRCIQKEIKDKNRVGMPKRLGPGHAPAADINNFSKFNKQLRDQRIICGCSKYGEYDLRHCSPGLPGRDGEVACEVNVWLGNAKKKAKRAIKRWFK